jgi:hypothetical protein
MCQRLPTRIEADFGDAEVKLKAAPADRAPFSPSSGMPQICAASIVRSPPWRFTNPC